MLSRSGWRRFLPGGRRNRRDEHRIQAIPISEAGPLLHEEEIDPEVPVSYPVGQPYHPVGEPNLSIDYGRFQEGVAVAHSASLGTSLSHVMAVPESQHSQHYGERAITQVDYDGTQTVRSENFIPMRRRSLSHSRSRQRRGSRHSSKAPDITIQPPSIMNAGEHIRSGSPDPLPVPPRNYKDGYHGERTRRLEPERHRSRRGGDYYDRSYGHVHGGEMAAPPPVRGNIPGEHVTHSITRHLDSLEHPEFRFSRCTGRKKAVCIGINYTGQNSQLDGCISDAKNMCRFLIGQLGFRSRDIIRLTDDARDPRNLPTRQNMLGAMRWLVRDAHKNDSLFFHYSGHGSQVRDLNGDEVDGYDEVIFPIDYSQAGTIIDDELHDNLVKPLPPGCRLTAIFDSCHSGSVLDVPFNYHSDGRVKSSSVTKEFIGEKASPAEVICWSGSTDSGTAADVQGGGMAVGAMSYAFLNVLNGRSWPTYEELLRDLRRATRKYHQKPQLSASHRIDVNRRFVI
ncbi:caspase domain-containing protein [Russula compacta]|nr:caspase domain-containing protein [Russula compacta]